MSSGQTKPGGRASDRTRPSARRRRNSETRRRIEQAAARLFTRDGYTATTMQGIADEAQVHVQTIYLAYGSKSVLLAASAARLVAGEEDPGIPPGERRWAREVAAEPDARAKLARYVSHIVDVSPRITPLLDVLRATAPAEPDVAAFLNEMELGRREGPLQLLGIGVAPGTWRGGLSPEMVADITFAVASPDTVRALTERSGWTRSATQELILDLLQRELLDD